MLSPKKKRLINKYMKHNETTVDRYYVIAIEAKCSANAHQLMQDVVLSSMLSMQPLHSRCLSWMSDTNNPILLFAPGFNLANILRNWEADHK